MRSALVLGLAAALAAGCKSKSKSKPGPKPAGRDGGGAAEPFTPPSYPPVVDDWWKEPDKHCPPGTHLRGGGPPENTQASCAVRDSKSYEIKGPRTTFNEQGVKIEEGWYEGGEKVGPWRGWYDDGKPRYEAVFVAGGGQTGRHRQWSEAGALINDYEIKDGNGTATWKDADGNVDETGEIRGGLRHGTWKKLDSGGKVIATIEYRAGKRHGTMTRFDDSGARIGETDYADGEKHGGERRIDPKTGQVILERVFERGDQVGLIYFQDGTPLARARANPDCDTDEEVSRILETREGRGLDKRYSCVNRPRTFRGLIQVGSFANDRGCMPRTALVDCKPGNFTTTEVLDMAGWDRARPKIRELIAVDFIRQVRSTFGDSLASEPEAPVVTSTPEGAVTVTAWVVEPAGMLPERISHKLRFSFTPGGTMTTETLETRRE